MAAWAPLIGALFTIAACYSLGSFFLARMRVTLARREKAPLAFTLGAALLHLAIFAILALHIAYTPVLVALQAAMIGAVLWTGDWRLPAAKPGTRTAGFRGVTRCLLFAAAVAFTVVYFANAWAPEISPDGSGYHLPIIARYLRVHGFQAVPTNLYADLSQGVEMVFLPAFAIGNALSGTALSGGGSAAALVHFGFLIALALAVRAYGHRTGHALAGDAAALLVYISPVAGYTGTTAYVDVATAAIVFSAFYWTQLWDDDRRNALLICVGLMAGYCYAAKYTAAVMAIYGAGFILWRSRSVRGAGLATACAILMAGPWLVKNWIYVHNPLAPFANRIFRNPYIRPDFERRWTAFLKDYGVEDRRKLPWMVIVDGGVAQTPLGVVFLILPIGLLALRKKTGRRVLAPAAMLLSTYFANIGTRFLLPSLPFLSLAIAIACEEVPAVLVIILCVHAVASWPEVLRRYATADALILRRTPFRAALRKRSEQSFLGESRSYRAARFIERVVPSGGKVFAMAGVAEAYTSRDVLVDYAGATNEQLSDILSAAWDEIVKPSRALVFRFQEHALRRIRVVQTAAVSKSDEQWSVHEFRIYRAGVEVPRSSRWHLRAFPSPWDVPYAFDNSEVTRWRSWETASPGMYIDVDFSGELRADEIRIETSMDDPDVRLRLEEWTGAGWKVLVPAPEAFTFTPEASLRRAAAYELRSAGIRYLFVRDDDPGAKEYAQDPESWNFTRLARSEGATLYRIGM